MIKPDLCIIVAASENNVIGKDGDIPWKIQGDLQYVKAKTWGKPIIMGRKTFESMGSRPLAGRANIVVTSQNLSENGFYVRSAFNSALREAETIAAGNNVDEIFIFGGQKMYEEALPKVKRIYLTRVHKTIENGDAFFPALDKEKWIETEREDVDEGKGPAHSYLTLERAA